MFPRILMNIFFILLGPFITFLIAVKKSKPIWFYYLYVSIFSIVTIIVATQIYFSRKTVEGSVTRSGLYSIGIHIAMMCFFLLITEGGLGWLPVLVPVMAVYNVPLAFLVTFGTIRILDDIRQQKGVKETSKE